MTTMEYSRVALTYGALLVGAFIAASLSGVLTVQCLLYIKLFPKDELRVKAIVGIVWVLDQAHSIMVFVSIWIYVIKGFGNYDAMDVISHYLALTVLLTGTLTFVVHCFFTHRIYRLSGRNWRLTATIATLAVCRISAAIATTIEMIHLGTLPAFKASFQWLFTLGLAFSCVEDILITSSLVYSLQSLQGPTGRRTSSSLDHVVGSVILYTLETNSLTAVWTIVCMVFWLTMPNNFVFMASHFFICKLYGNSLLATLNTRKQLRNQRQRGISADFSLSLPRFTRTADDTSQAEPPLTTKIFIEQTVEYSSDSASEDRTRTTPPHSRVTS